MTFKGNCFLENPIAISQYSSVKDQPPSRNGAVLEGNHFWRNEAVFKDLEADEPGQEGDPLFADPGNGDFTPRPGSALLDEGGQSVAGLSDHQIILRLWGLWAEETGRSAEAAEARQAEMREWAVSPAGPPPGRETESDGMRREYEERVAHLETELSAYRSSWPVFSEFSEVFTEVVVPWCIRGEEAGLRLKTKWKTAADQGNVNYDGEVARALIEEIVSSLFKDIFAQCQEMLEAKAVALSPEEDRMFKIISHFAKTHGDSVEDARNYKNPYEEGTVEHDIFAGEIGDAVRQSACALKPFIFNLAPELQREQREIEGMYDRLASHRLRDGEKLPSRYTDKYLGLLESHEAKVGERKRSYREGKADPAAAVAGSHDVPALAWQSSDPHVAPDATSFFPDDPEAGKRLDALINAVDKDERSDEEILATVRAGLRRSREDRGNVLRWFGNRYVWGKSPQNPKAVEIMYHATGIDQGPAIYFGLSVVENKTPAILRTLCEIAMETDDPNDLHRIAWGCGSQKAELIAFLEPHLASGDSETREKAEILERIFGGELKAFEWAGERRLAKMNEEFADRLPEFREQLLNGDSETRKKTLRQGFTSIVDDSFIEAMEACAKDPDPDVRRKVAREAGNHWVWGAEKQNPRAIALMLELSRDDDVGVRGEAIYFGLSTVREKSETVARRLIEMALTDHEWNRYGRIVWGLTHFDADKEMLERLMAEPLDKAGDDPYALASAWLLYGGLLGKEPPDPQRFAEALSHYPGNWFGFSVQPQEPFAPESGEELWEEVRKTVPAEIDLAERSTRDSKGVLTLSARARGADETEAAKASITANQRLRFGKVFPITPHAQLYEEEVQRWVAATAGR
jgi:hypothetical protein